MNLKNRGNYIFKLFAYTFLIILALVILFPFVCAVTASFKETREILISPNILPKVWRVDGYKNAWKIGNFAKYTWNSVWYSAIMVFISVLTSSMNGYAFARGEFRGKKFFFSLFTALMFIVLGSSSMYPTLQILKVLHLNQSLWGLIFKSFFAIHVSNMYLVRGFVNSLPKELDEAAEIDGCSFFRTFVSIYLPIMKPIIATVAIFSFGGAWNDYLMPMVVTISNPAQKTLSVGLAALKGTTEAAANWNMIMAGSMISALPMLLIFLFFNRYFISGLAAGAVKG